MTTVHEFTVHATGNDVHISGLAVKATIGLVGATLNDYSFAGHRIVDGYLGGEELARQDGVRSGVLAPFAGRIRDARYRFAQEAYDLLPGSADRTIFHGRARTELFRLVDCKASGGQARVALEAEMPAAPGYPWSLRVDVAFTITTSGVDVDISASNLSDSDAPISLGWHPYFRLASAPRVDDLSIRVPAAAVLALDEDLFPDHNAAPVSVEGTDADLRKMTPLGGRTMDTCYLELTPDAKGRIRTELQGPDGAERLVVWQDSGLVYLYTGDRLDRDPRSSLAVESISVKPDAFNDPALAPQVTLHPGERRTFRCGFEYSTT
jgi:aldose 1-epimerase